jgi:hypothetical protein
MTTTAADASIRDWRKLTGRQREALEAAHSATDGSIQRGFSRIWGIAPTAIYALVKKGYLEMLRGQDRARLTPAGRSLVERVKA